MSFILRDPEGLASRLPGIAPRGWEDGYDWAAKNSAWHIAYSWGRDGWDLGDPPYSMYGFADSPDGTAFGYLSYCEGDITIITFRTREERDAELDKAFLFHLRHGRLREELLAPIHAVRVGGKAIDDLTPDDLPARLRGHFSWARLEREKPLTTNKEDA